MSPVARLIIGRMHFKEQSLN